MEKAMFAKKMAANRAPTTPILKIPNSGGVGAKNTDEDARFNERSPLKELTEEERKYAPSSPTDNMLSPASKLIYRKRPLTRKASKVFSIFVGGFSFYVCRGAYAALEGLRQQTLEDADVARKFNEADTNGDGKLDINEIKCLCSSLGYNLSRFELESAFFVLDRDGGGDVSLEEFQYWFSHRSEV
jgi:hypothetical protein